ncbi:hypothetical protein D9619_012320 [Psilocybe cf. subviscida]|uniref:(2E,6E)-farnesyl diphosphate synthase n=1 Tax=Psilocybe cf. subviscida TaxID=2480587 RepID=A0A8H5AR90_9AGAR|nr:hypothetical protein D9619_012320 [Psilocybe cf. subviscida]
MYSRWLARAAAKKAKAPRTSAFRSLTTEAATKPPAASSPHDLLSSELATLRCTLLPLLGAGHPVLSDVAQYYFRHPSKQVRPLIVLLLAQATNGLGHGWARKLEEAEKGLGVPQADWNLAAVAGDGAECYLDQPLTRRDVLTDWNPHLPTHTAAFGEPFSVFPPTLDASVEGEPSPSSSTTPARTTNPLQRVASACTTSTASSSSSCTPSSTSGLAHTILPTQIRLAQVVEMMHTASLLHDDVIDASPLRRGSPSAPSRFSNKRAVLGGNFVLGRASAALARLGDDEATELIASVLANLVEGEILQLREVVGAAEAEAAAQATRVAEDEGKTQPPPSPEAVRAAWTVYLQKTYLKTASLMAKGARASVVLGGCEDAEEGAAAQWKDIAYAYGRNLGIAFQLVDDVLDYESLDAADVSKKKTDGKTGEETLGKPAGADLQLGLATGPALYAWEEHPAMGALIARKFNMPGDVDMARELVARSSGVARTRELALAYANKARDVLAPLPPSPAKDALLALAGKVVKRKS